MKSYDENPVQEIISLQLKKPKNWNWEICTSKSTSFTALPVIQLFNAKGSLLAQSQFGQNAKRNKIIRPRRSKSDGCFQNFNTNSNSNEFRTRLPTCGEENKRENQCYIIEEPNSLISDHTLNTVKIERLKKPTKYKLTQSRAGILVIADESFSENHQKRCHGRSRRCSAEDENRSNSLKYSDPPKQRKNESLCASTFSPKLALSHSQSEKVFRNGRKVPVYNKQPYSSSDSELEEFSSKRNNYGSARNAKKKGPFVCNQKVSNKDDYDLLQLVRQRSLPKFNEKSILLHPRFKRNAKSDLLLTENTTEKLQTSKVQEREENENCHVIGGMGANVSRHSTKGLSGRRSQSSSSICNGKGKHNGSGSGKSASGSLPSYLDDGGSTSTNNYDEDEDDEKQPQEAERISPLGDGAALHWKFSDVQTAQDQGYGSERSPEEEYPPPLPEHDLDQCHHHLEAHSCYPFITPDSTFTVKLNKGSRGLGLSVTGGFESEGSWPGLVRIKRLFPHQPASACGLLNVGDLLLEANGVPLTGLTNYEALEVLRTATNQVELKVCRPPPDVLNCVSPVSEVPPPPPTRREPPNSLHFTSGYFGTTPEDEYYHGEFEITLTKIQGSLGFTLRKEDDSPLGHYVRALVREPALTDGRIKPGDKIIAVNDMEIFPMTHEQAVQYLRQCGDKVKLRLYRDLPQNSPMSPTETTPRKANLRQEAVDMLNDIAARKMVPNNQSAGTEGSSLSPASSPRRLKRQNYPGGSDAGCEEFVGAKYLIPEEQFHEGMLKCKHFDEEAFSSLFTIDNDDMDRLSRPNSLDLYNPNQTPVAARKPRFNFSLAHNAYELNNLDPEVLDAPNLTYTIGNDESVTTESETRGNYPTEPASMPHIPLDKSSGMFSYKKPTYQSAHPPCIDSDKKTSSSASKDTRPTTNQDEETDTIKRKKGILKKDPNRSFAKTENIKTEKKEMMPMKEEIEVLAIELNRGWNSRLGFSLQGAAGVTYVSAVYPDSVAAKDGRIKPGDRIIKVNDEEVEHMSTSEIIDFLRIVRGPVCIFVKRIKSNEDCPRSNAEN